MPEYMLRSRKFRPGDIGGGGGGGGGGVCVCGGGGS